MSDPERLLHSTDGQHELERSLLGSLRVVTVPARARGLVWGVLSVTVAEATAMAGAATSASSSATLLRGALKLLGSSKALLAVPVVIAALGAGVVHYSHKPAAVVPGVHSALLAPVTLAPSAPTAAPEANESAELAPTLSEPVEATQRRSSLAERLHQESALLTRARAELRGGRPGAAQATLSRMQRAFGTGALSQERAVLSIEALAAQGNAAAAARGARAFIAAHPESPHSAALRRFIPAE